ncbi:helix-turn-helix domain-containing protein [Erythrobacter sp.]|uniref:helix-turn-helix transcriptional regulator n=1 Tax=Erythrobacter sp. TaxID=1042 RepID=UPI0025ECFAB0|nr:helix-turn-helix domain-containing protein [Erythrobacter sp.]
MARAAIRLPEFVALPAARTIDAAELREALGVSKAVVHTWRRDQGFPHSYRVGHARLTATADVERWLLARGVAVGRLSEPVPVPPSPPPVPMPPGYVTLERTA